MLPRLGRLLLAIAASSCADDITPPVCTNADAGTSTVTVADRWAFVRTACCGISR